MLSSEPIINNSTHKRGRIKIILNILLLKGTRVNIFHVSGIAFVSDQFYKQMQ